MAEPAKPRLILASASRSRGQMLAAAGVEFTVIPSKVDEPELRRKLEADGRKREPSELAGFLARAKAEDVSRENPGALVIGADQVLSLGSTIYGKPKDLDEARRHLNSFRGRLHELHSAVALAENGAIVWSDCRTASLTMRLFSRAFVDDYLARVGSEVCQSVGAYQLEGLGLQLFEAVEGDYFTILGLPLLPLLAQLRSRRAISS